MANELAACPEAEEESELAATLTLFLLTSFFMTTRRPLCVGWADTGMGARLWALKIGHTYSLKCSKSQATRKLNDEPNQRQESCSSYLALNSSKSTGIAAGAAAAAIEAEAVESASAAA